ncbi:hypothetical protein D9M69_403530 [compost metagenome]
MQGRLLLGQPALVEDVAAALVEAFQRFVEVGRGAVAPVGILQLAGRVVAVVFQVVRRRLEGAFVVGVGGRVEGHVLAGQAAFHLAHFMGLDAQALGHRMHFVVVQPGQALLLAAQVEEQLALRLGGDLDDAPVAQDELVDLGANPVHGERHQAHAHFRVEALHRLHQADVAFLDQVALGQAVTRVALGDVHDEAQVGQHQLPGRLQVLLVVEAFGQLALLLDAQQRNAVHRVHVGFEVGPRRQGIDRLQGSGHVNPPIHELSSSVLPV